MYDSCITGSMQRLTGQADHSDLTYQLSKIKGWGPDVVFDFSHDAEAALIVRQLDELGMGEIPHVGPNALAQSQTYDLCDAKQLEGTYASTDFCAAMYYNRNVLTQNVLCKSNILLSKSIINRQWEG